MILGESIIERVVATTEVSRDEFVVSLSRDYNDRAARIG